MYEIIIGRTESDKKRFGKKATIFLGKHYVRMGQTASLASDILLDVNRSHVVFVCGKRGSGKSYTLAVICEGMLDLPQEIKQNLSFIIFDTMGIFWTLKYPNTKQRDLLKQWNLEPKAFDPVIYVPSGLFEQTKAQGLPADLPFSLLPSELSEIDWCQAFGLDPLSPAAVLIDRIINELKRNKKRFTLDDIISAVRKDKKADKHTKDLVESNFERAKAWGLFSEKATPIAELAKPGKVSIIDISCYATMPGTFGVRALVIGIISRKLFMERMAARKLEEYAAIKEATTLLAEKPAKRKIPLVWLFLDEAHEFIPRDKKTAASDALITILREGRQPGISLVLASQQPGKIHTDVMTQSDVVIAHRLTAKIDIDALGLLMQTYLRRSLDKEIDSLPRVKGAAIIFDETVERLYPMRVRPRMSWHSGEAPTALREIKEKFKL